MPSDFNLAINTILTHEGAFVNNPHDPGRATNWGISLRYMQDLTPHETVTEETIKDLTKEQAATIYRVHFWDKYGYSRINDQIVATKVFDLAVNLGGKIAHIAAQRAVRAAIGWKLVEDGELGTQSITMINMAKPFILMAALKSEAAGEYRLIVQKKPEMITFLLGWLSRAYSDCQEKK